MLEPRLFPLLETLVRAGLDWLAQEIILGALAGRVAEESPENLQAARSIVFRPNQDSAEWMLAEPYEERAEAFSADEQIEWAAQHVAQRLEQILQMFQYSIDRLNAITRGNEPRELLQSTDASIVLLLTDGQAVSRIDRTQLSAATEGLSQLRDALDAWAADARRGEQT